MAPFLPLLLILASSLAWAQEDAPPSWGPKLHDTAAPKALPRPPSKRRAVRPAIVRIPAAPPPVRAAPVGIPPLPPLAVPAPPPFPAPVNGCDAGGCRDPAGNRYNASPGGAAVDSSGRLCTVSGSWVQCF